MAVFLTGATGFLGTETAAELIRTTKEKIYVLVRAADNEEAVHRLRTVWYEIKELYREIGERIIPLTGDFTQADLGLEHAVLRQLRGEISVIYHIGAETGIQKSQKDLMTINRNGTGYMIRFARKMDREGEVFGGEMRAIKNSSLGYVNIREEPGEDSTVVATVNNGEMVETTGETCKKGGYVWYRVHLASGSDDAWIAGSLIDY